MQAPGRVHDLYVDPEARRFGVGKSLMNFIFDWSSNRPRPMILDWQATPSAVGFYEALGFRADHVGDFPDHPGFTLDLRAFDVADRLFPAGPVAAADYRPHTR